MAYSGKNGTVKYGASPTALTNEVVSWTATVKVASKGGATDKAPGWDDPVAGTKSVDGTVDVRARGEPDFGPGQVVAMKLYKFGSTATPYAGNALITDVTISVNVENGEPVTYKYTFKGKGVWTGFPNDAGEWGGFDTSGQ
jgi:hypothetical protein